MAKKSILIIALSARPFVKAASAAGYKVTAIDGFSDQETTQLADKTFVVDFDANGFVVSQLLQKVKSLTLDDYLGCLYGSGFDAQPALLQQLAALLPLIGNSPECVAKVKTASNFFAGLDALTIQYPATYFSKSFEAQGQIYLQKFAGGCGGVHIQLCDEHSLNTAPKNHYFQQYIAGDSVSLLFLACNKKVTAIGFNELLISKSEDIPFRYGGAVSNIDFPQKIKTQLIDYAEKLTQYFGLVGLNSLDVIVKNDVVYVLEINPRLSATFDLYADDMRGLFEAHLQAGMLENEALLLTKHTNQSNAHTIFYATYALQISNTFIWPSWVVDTPTKLQAVTNVEIDAPVCTVIANAETSDAAKQLLQSRVKILLETLTHHSLKPLYASKT